jgi:hypothetical protein
MNIPKFSVSSSGGQTKLDLNTNTHTVSLAAATYSGPGYGLEIGLLFSQKDLWIRLGFGKRDISLSLYMAPQYQEIKSISYTDSELNEYSPSTTTIPLVEVLRKKPSL